MTPPPGEPAARRRGPTVDITCERRFAGVTQRALLQASKRLLVDGLALERAQVSISVVGDDSMRALNRHWRHKDRPTDVLSFPLQPPPARGRALPADAALGDLALCAPQAARQAHLRGHSTEDELLVLLVHGLLHLCGHDHVRGGRQAARMRREEQRLLRLLSPPGRLLRCLLG